VWWAGVAAAAVCAGVVSYYASASPDGLNKVANDHGIGQQAEESGTADSPLAGYSVADITDDRLAGGLAGLIGVGGTLALGTGVFVVVRRRHTDDRDVVAGTR
jgi:cobalt/nickel transport system permease protein